MPQDNRNTQENTAQQGRQQPLPLTAVALRGIGQIYDMQMSTARVLLQTQARAASAFGWPDMSGLFNSVNDRASHVFAQSAEQWVQTAQRAKDATAELQREVGRVVETQTAAMADTMQQGMEEIGTRTSDSLGQLTQTVREQADEAERAAAALTEEVRQSLQEGSAQVREGMQRGGEQARNEVASAVEDAARSQEDKNKNRHRAAA